MQRTLKELVLKNGDYVYDGDLTIDGKVLISNGSLRVSGKLFLKGLSETGNSPTVIINGDIVADSFTCRALRICCRGNIIIHSKLDVCHVICNRDILVGDCCYAYNVICHNYLITGNNDSDDVTAEEDIYVLGYNCSGDLKAREIFLGDFTKFAPYGPITVEAQHFECTGPIQGCRTMKIG